MNHKNKTILIEKCIKEIVKGGRTDELVTSTCNKYNLSESYIRNITEWKKKRKTPKFRNARKKKVKIIKKIFLVCACILQNLYYLC